MWRVVYTGNNLSYKYVITFICHIKATIFSFSANIPVFVSQKLVNFTHLHKQMRIFHMKIITQKLLMKKRLKSQKRCMENSTSHHPFNLTTFQYVHQKKSYSCREVNGLLVKNFKNNQTPMYISSKKKIVCPLKQTLLAHAPLCACRLPSIRVCKCVGVDVGLCTRHNLCRTD